MIGPVALSEGHVPGTGAGKKNKPQAKSKPQGKSPALNAKLPAAAKQGLKKGKRKESRRQPGQGYRPDIQR